MSRVVVTKPHLEIATVIPLSGHEIISTELSFRMIKRRIINRLINEEKRNLTPSKNLLPSILLSILKNPSKSIETWRRRRRWFLTRTFNINATILFHISPQIRWKLSQSIGKKPRNRAIEDLNAVYGGGGRVARNIVNLRESYVELKLKGNTPTLHLLRSSSNAFIFSWGVLVWSYESENTGQLCVKPPPPPPTFHKTVYGFNQRFEITLSFEITGRRIRIPVKRNHLVSDRVDNVSKLFSPKYTFETTFDRGKKNGTETSQWDDWILRTERKIRFCPFNRRFNVEKFSRGRTTGHR